MITLVRASPELAFAARAMIALEMAAHLTDGGVNIRDPEAVDDHLSDAGFGYRSVVDLRFYAVAISSNYHVISFEVH